MEFNIYENLTTQQLKDRLGWWNHSGAEDTAELITVCMILCDKIAALETLMEKAEARRERNANRQ